MLHCEIASPKPEHFDDLVVFASQLQAAGVAARLHAPSVPADLHRNSQFDIAPLLFEGGLGMQDRVVLLGAHEIADTRLVQLRRIAKPPATACLAIGTFATAQALIGAKAKLSYVFGEDPEILNLAGAGAELHPRCPVFGIDLRARAKRIGRRGDDRQILLLIAPNLADRAQARALMSLAVSRKLRPVVLTDGKTKHEWQKANGSDIAFYHYGEILPAALAWGVDLALACATLASYRLRALIANLAMSGVPLFDGSDGHAVAKVNDAFIPAPLDLSLVGTYFGAEILPNIESAGEKLRRSRYLKSIDPAPLLAMLAGDGAGGRSAARAARPLRPAEDGAEAGPARTIFVPTNGVGLGHAQRCSQVAAELDRGLVEPIFAAFPSCIKLLKSYGFDVMPLVSRSVLHAQTHENDLVNYARLKALGAGATSLVFDGGYVFDSIYRSILENGLRGVWIRRGLWQEGQDNSIALDREKVFDCIIVPAEAFDELNQSYSRGEHIEQVGPIVQRVALSQADRATLRAKVGAIFGRSFEHLAVTMLGGGIAADRTPQTNAVCATMARRREMLHLLVVWPTAVVDPSWFTWPNTVVVKTHHASTLVAAADVYVSAAGYNAFHEVLYNRVPAIFMPQMSTYMDDQQARARSAAERGVAEIVEPHEIMTLDQLIGEYLDEGRSRDIRARLAEVALPEPGNAAAARIIEEIAHGRPEVGAHRRPHNLAMCR